MPRSDENQTVRELAAEMLVERRKMLLEPAAEMLGHPTGAVEMKAKEERRLFWRRAITPEQEAELWAQGVPPAEISTKVYPRRWELFGKQGGLAEGIAWAKRMSRLGPPEQGDEGEQTPATVTTAEEGAY